MNKKISLGVAISLIAVGCAITFVLTWTISLNLSAAKSKSDQAGEILNKISEVDKTVKARYIGEIDEDELVSEAVKGYVAGIGDKYAEYMPPADYYELQQTDSGVVVSTGMRVVEDAAGFAEVYEVYENSAAAEAGVQKGDVITEINGKTISEIGFDKAKTSLSADEGTKVKIKAIRNGEELNFTLISKKVEIITVKGEMLGTTGYVRISSFNKTTSQQFETLIEQFIKDGAASFVFDVRQNSGGSVSPLKAMLNRFVPAGVAAYSEYADGTKNTLIETDGTDVLSMPIAVLVDNGTMSASELFAAILRDSAGAVLVGNQTYGKALMQEVIDFKDGSALRLSVAKVYSKGSDYYGDIGLKPDYSVDLAAGLSENIDNINKQADEQLQKALEVLESRQ